MASKVLIPTPLKQYAGNQTSLELSGATVGELLESLTQRHSALKGHLYSEQGKLRDFVAVYVNEEDIRHLQQEKTPVGEHDVVSIVPSIAGGRSGMVEAGGTTFTREEIKRYSRHLIMP